MIVNMDQRRAYHIRNYLLQAVQSVVKKDGVLSLSIIALTCIEVVIQMWVGIFNNMKETDSAALARLDELRQSMLERIDACRQVVASGNPLVAAELLGLVKGAGYERDDSGAGAGAGAKAQCGAEGNGATRPSDPATSAGASDTGTGVQAGEQGQPRRVLHSVEKD